MARGDWSEGWYKQRLARQAAALRRAQATSSKVRASLEFYAPEGTPRVDLETLETLVDADVPRETKGVPEAPDVFVALCVQEGLPAPLREFAFHPGRRWRFDYAWPGARIAVEQEGGIWAADGSRAKAAHARPAAIVRDMEKGNAAVLLGWRVLRFEPSKMHEACQAVKLLLHGG